MKKIEGEFGLWEKEVPKVGWKCSINASQDCQEVVLEGVNGALCPIAVMHVMGNELEGGIPLEGDGFFVSRAGFLIQDLEINGETLGCQASHDCVVWTAMRWQSLSVLLKACCRMRLPSV